MGVLKVSESQGDSMRGAHGHLAWHAWRNASIQKGQSMSFIKDSFEDVDIVTILSADVDLEMQNGRQS
jgi:hypothetical protein